MAAVAHVVAEPAGVSFVPQLEQQLFYDEAAGLLHLVEGRMCTAVALPPPDYSSGHGAASAASAAAGGSSAGPAGISGSSSPDPLGYESDSSIASCTARAFLVSEGPPVRHIRSSLDGAFTALHRSARLVEFHCHARNNMFVETAGADKQGRKGGDPQLLGFFWTAAHFVMVTAGGLEIHTVHPSCQALRLDSGVPLQGVQWYTYSPETNVVVLGFGSSGAKLQAIQFSKAGTLKLPLLDLTPPWGSPIRPVMAAAATAALDGFSAAREQPARLVGPDTCWVVVLYGRVFCCHHDRGAGLLRLYRMFRDATSLAHQYEVYAKQLELSVVDNVLLVHHINSAVVMLIDILAPGAAPISSPLPLALPLADEPMATPSRPTAGGAQDPELATSRAAGGVAPELNEDGSADGGQPAGMEQQHGAAAGAMAAAAAAVVPVASTALQLHYPSFLVDGSTGMVYRLQLDLQAIADSQSEYPRLLAFLQRRRPAAAPRRDAAGITLRVLRGLMQDEVPLAVLRRVFDVVNSFAGHRSNSNGSTGSSTGGTHAGSRASSSSDLQAAGAGSAVALRATSPARRAAAAQLQLQPCAVVTPQDVYNSGFALLRAQQRARPAYLQAALADYVASCAAHGLPVAPSLAALYVDLLLDQGLVHLVAPLLLSHPCLDSVLLAEHVEEAAAAGRLPAGAQLAERLLLRLGAHEARCRLLLRQGRTRQALRLVVQHGLAGQLAPAALLEAAAGTGDGVLFAAVHHVYASAGVPPSSLGSLQEGVAAHRQQFGPAEVQALEQAVAG